MVTRHVAGRHSLRRRGRREGFYRQNARTPEEGKKRWGVAMPVAAAVSVPMPAHLSAPVRDLCVGDGLPHENWCSCTNTFFWREDHPLFSRSWRSLPFADRRAGHVPETGIGREEQTPSLSLLSLFWRFGVLAVQTQGAFRARNSAHFEVRCWDPSAPSSQGGLRARRRCTHA